MRKIVLFATILSLLCSQTTQAGPITWAKRHKRFLLMESAAVGAAGIHAAGLHHCRKVNGVEPCDEHYGLAWAAFGIFAGTTIVIFPAIAEGCWKNEGGKFCNTFAYGISIGQASWGIHEWTINKPHNDEHIKSVQLIKH